MKRLFLLTLLLTMALKSLAVGSLDNRYLTCKYVFDFSSSVTNYSITANALPSYNPHWTFNPHQYEHTMTMVGLVKVDGEEQRAPYFEVGAFCDNECRGSAMLQYLPRYDKYLAFLTVYGEDGNSIKFKLFDHSNGYEVGRETLPFLFAADTICGNPGEPFVFDFANLLTITTQVQPSGGGTVTGGGEYFPGELCTLTAEPNNVYSFTNWTKDGIVVSDSASYSFVVTENATYTANFEWINPGGDYIADGLIMYLDGICNTRNGHDSTTNVWEDLTGNYDLTVTGYYSYTWEDNHFFGLGDGGYLNTGKTWSYFNSLNNDITIEIVTYIDCDKVSPPWRGLAGWHTGSDGTNFQNDQGGGRMETLGQLPVSEADNTISTVSYTRTGGSFLNGEWKIDVNNIGSGVYSNHTVVFGNSYAQSRGWNDSIYCIRMYDKSLTPEEIAYNHGIDMERFGAVAHTEITITAIANPAEGGTVNGAGIYNYGETCTLTATANPNYTFVNWTKDGTEVSTSTTYQFEVSGSADYVANFSVHLPELHVTSTTHSEFVGGQTASVSWTVQNDGMSATPTGATWYDRVYLSPENEIRSDGAWTLLGEFENLTALEPGEYYTQTQTFTLPLRMSGPYYLFVITDSRYAYDIEWDSLGMRLPYNPPPFIMAKGYPSSVFEMSEYVKGNSSQNTYYHDNFYFDLVNVTVPPLPDLQVTSIVPPTNFYSGTTISVTATISNMGEDRTQADWWTDCLYISDTSVFIPSRCTYLDSRSHYGHLYPNGAYQQTFQGTVPITMYGEAYFYVYTDYYQQNYEHIMNDNNVSRSDAVNIILTPPADLVPTINSYPQSASTGTSFPVSFSIRNQGAGNPDTQWWQDCVFLSTNPDGLGNNPQQIAIIPHSGNLTPNAEYTISQNISLPNSLENGIYYLYVVTDYNNDVFEYLYDSNNTVRSTNSITITKPDLSILQITAPSTLIEGYPFTISYVLENSGEGTIENWNIHDRISVTQNANLSSLTTIATVNNNELNIQPNQTVTVNYNGIMPNDIPEGVYYLYLETDCLQELNESNEYNNYLVKHPITIVHKPLPDLSPTILTLPETINAGTDAEISFDVINTGELDVLDAVCNINLYAVKENDSILCPMKSQTLPLGGPNISILTGETVHFVRTVNIPYTVNSQYTKFVLKVDASNHIEEMDENNNTFINYDVTVNNCPLPDLIVSSIELPSTMQVGVTNQVSLYVKNIGELELQNASMNFSVMANEGDGYICPIQNIIEPQPNNNISLAIGESIHVVMDILVPPMVSEACQTMTFTINPKGTIIETDTINNSTSTTVDMAHYPFDLELVSMSVPNELLGGRTYEISWTVKNIGTCPSSSVPMYVDVEDQYTSVAGNTLPVPWTDYVYFSNDNVLSDTIELTSANHSTVLNPNGTYTVTKNFVAPYAEGTKYIIVDGDGSQTTYDYNTANNKSVQAVTVGFGTLPDLLITDMDVDAVLNSGDSYWIHYTVTNNGENATLVDAWTDAFYIGMFDGIINNAATLVGSKIHNGFLGAGAFYTDSVQVTPTNGLEGSFYFMGYTDATTVVFENDNEDNNISSVPVFLVKPLPCDLTVIGIEHPAETESGEDLTVSWQVNNIGSHAAYSKVRDAVYLSEDDVWGSDDVMLGYIESNIEIPANAIMPRQLTAKLPGVTEGNYHVIVKTNIQYALNETSYENNVSTSMSEITIDYPILDIGGSVSCNLNPDQTLYYRIIVGPEYVGQTLSCRLHTNSALCMNKLYLAFNDVPTLANFDFGAATPMKQDLEVLIPSLEEGSYYVLVNGDNSEHQPQSITLEASIINFEILHVDTDHGANTGSITTQIIGAKFESVMDFRLAQGNGHLPAEKVFFTNSTETYATFNLTDMPAGSYDMIAELPGGVITVKGQAFQIQEGLPAELSVNIVGTSSVLVGNKFTYTIEYGNHGNTDLNVSGFVVTCNYPIAFSQKDLELGLKEITFMTGEENGNPDVLRPGYMNSKIVFVNANSIGTVHINVYAIRRQY